MGCLVHGSIFYPKKKTCILVSTLFYLGGVFGVFFAKIIVFMGRVLVHSIYFSFHSISGLDLLRELLVRLSYRNDCICHLKKILHFM